MSDNAVYMPTCLSSESSVCLCDNEGVIKAGKENLQSLLYVEDNLSQFVNQHHQKYLLQCFQKLFQMNHDLSQPIECAQPPADCAVLYSANKDELEILEQ